MRYVTFKHKLPGTYTSDMGSSPETADWVYGMGAEGSDRGTGTSGLATFCHSCHTAAAATDFSFINSAFYRNQNN